MKNFWFKKNYKKKIIELNDQKISPKGIQNVKFAIGSQGASDSQYRLKIPNALSRLRNLRVYIREICLAIEDDFVSKELE